MCMCVKNMRPYPNFWAKSYRPISPPRWTRSKLHRVLSPQKPSSDTDMPSTSPRSRQPSPSFTQDESPGRDVSARSSNPLAGKLFLLKRPGSPSANWGSSKSPRFDAFVTREDLQNELHGLKAEIDAGFEQVRKSLPSPDSIRTAMEACPK